METTSLEGRGEGVIMLPWKQYLDSSGILPEVRRKDDLIRGVKYVCDTHGVCTLHVQHTERASKLTTTGPTPEWGCP
jgi:hypothetical protein